MPASAERLATLACRHEVTLRVLPLSRHRREHAQAQGHGAERLLGVADRVAIAMRLKLLVEQPPSLLVVDEDAGFGQRTQMKEPEPVARHIGEAVARVALHLGARGTAVAEFGGDQGIPPTRYPRKQIAVGADRRPELAQPPLRPTNRKQLRVLEDIRRVLALAEPTELERGRRQLLCVCVARVEDRADDAQADRVPEIGRLADEIGDLCHRFHLPIEGGAVTELEEAVEARVVRQKLHLPIRDLLRGGEHLLGMPEPLEHPVRHRQRPVTGVEGGHERPLVADPPRNLDRLVAHGCAPLDRLVRRIQFERETREQNHPERAVVLGKRGERLGEQVGAGRSDLEPRVEQEAAERGHVAERRAGEQLALPEPACDHCRVLEARARGGDVSRPPLGIAEAQEQIAAPPVGALGIRPEQLESATVVPRRLLVGEQHRRAVSGPLQVGDRLRDVAERCREREMMGDLGQASIGIPPAQTPRGRPPSEDAARLAAAPTGRGRASP